MESSILKIAGQIAGIGGLALGVLLLIFRDVIRKNIFPTLTKEQAYRLIRLIVILAFAIAVFGILAWVYTSKLTSPSLNNTSLKVEPGIAPIKVELVSPKSGREIPVEQMADGYVLGSIGTPLEISDVFYDQQKKVLDVKVRNNTNESTIVSKVKLKFEYKEYYEEPRQGEQMEESATHDARIPKKDVEAAKAKKVPLSFEKGFDVSYVIPPKDADRYLFRLDLNKDDLYYPKPKDGGRYVLFINFYFNKGQRSGVGVSLGRLLQGYHGDIR